MRLKLTYVTLYPEKYPRVKKIAVALKDENVYFRALAPRVLTKLGSGKIERMFSAVVNYSAYLLMIFFSRADVYWVANSPDIFVLPLIMKRADYVLDYRSPWPLEVELEFGKGLLSRIAEFLTRVAIGGAKVITIPSSTLEKDLRRYYKKVYLIPNYPLKNRFEPSVAADKFRKQNEVSKNQKVILFTGRLSKVEGFDILVRIANELVGSRRDLVFWIVGDGTLKPQVQDLVAKFPENVKFFGWQSYEEIPNFVNAADVCIVPRHKTAFSHYYNEEGVQKIAEYMFFRKPIVACGIAPSKEYLLVEPEDMVNGILRALEGKVIRPTPRTWEDDCEVKVLEVLDFVKKLRNDN
jgi:glycosyltransferase involved in cell wall biosynthesis